MKYTAFTFIWLSLLALCFTIAGICSLFGWLGAEVVFMNSETIENKIGKMIWIVISSICFIVFLILAIKKIQHQGT